MAVRIANAIPVNAVIIHVVLTPSDVSQVGVTGKVEHMFFLFFSLSL